MSLESAAKSDSPEKQRYLNEKDWDMWERPHPNCHTWELFDFMDISNSPVASTMLQNIITSDESYIWVTHVWVIETLKSIVTLNVT